MGFLSRVVMSLLILSVIIITHELGHLVVALMLGVPVNAFSFGFGPEAVGFTTGTIRWKVSAIPMGGYVKLAQTDSYWRMLLITLAGPTTNILTAIAAIKAGAQLKLIKRKHTPLTPLTITDVIPGIGDLKILVSGDVSPVECALIFGVSNLLPIAPFDGSKIISMRLTGMTHDVFIVLGLLCTFLMMLAPILIFTAQKIKRGLRACFPSRSM